MTKHAVFGLGLLVCVACGATGGTPADAGAAETDADRGAAMLLPNATLPPRPEVVALTDSIAISASREAETDRQARLYRLAADLRARLYRFDRTDTDGREALELYATAARTAQGTEEACDADRARALFAGEHARSANATYRELYLARRRHVGLSAAGAQSACITSLDRLLARADAFRPTGAELDALEREGDRAADAARTASAVVQASASAAPIASSRPGIDLVVSPTGLEKAKGPVKVTSIEKYAAEGGGRVVIHLSGPTTFDVGALAVDEKAGKDARIFVDIARATVKGQKKEIEVGGAIKRVRAAARDDGARIVLDLAAEMHRRVFYLPEPFRIVVDVSSRPVGATAAVSKPGPRTVRRVAIDAGHGGHDSGAVGPTGLKEKDVALDIAHRVASLLAHELSVDTLVTRDDDVFVPLDERTARANAFHADLFVSIHCNASENGDARGIETFVLDSLKDTSRASARVAALENGLRGPGALDPAALDAEMALIMGRMQSGETGAASRKLGELMGRATLASLTEKYPDTSDHGLKSAGFYVLAGAEMPAVLFETSFISNPDDESRLAKADYRQKLADGIVNAIRAYKEGK